MSLTLLLLLLSSCNKNSKEITIQTISPPKQLVDNKTIYEFLNYCLNNKSADFEFCDDIMNRDLLPYYIINEDSAIVSELDTILNKNDIEFVLKQANYSPHFKLDPEYLKGKNIIALDTIKSFTVNNEVRSSYWENLHKRYGSVCFIRMPLFSRDFKTAIVDIGIHCGTLCGEGGRYVYKKKEGKWVLIATINEWVS